MSFKSLVVEETANRRVLPRTKGMQCDVVAYLSPELFAASEEDLWRDAYRSACFPGARAVYLMPDCHKGYVLPVGGVLVTDGTIVQAGSGYDISCGVVYLRVPDLHAADVADWASRQRWVAAIEERIATGYRSARPVRMRTPSPRLVEEILRHGAKAIGVPAEVCERQFLPVSDDFDSGRVERALAKAAPQLGSVGGGNHFVELQCDRDTGEVWVMVHCGSRGFGWQTADWFFKAGAELRGLPAGRREEAWLRVDEPLGRQYWAHHNAAANYAVANRHTIVLGVQEATEAVYGRRPEVFFEISHNLVQEETLVLPDGATARGFVHRKGSTRAFPAGHPDLAGTPWEATGHPCLIPGSMLAGAAILYPLAGAHRAGCSVNHGSGRVLGRNEAKRQLAARHDDIDAEMRTIARTCGGVRIEGIVGNCERTPLDECGHAYKDLDAVLQVLLDEGIARLHARLYPIANIKGAD